MGVKNEILTLYNTEILFDEPLSKHTHYKLGGKAKFFTLPKTVKDLNEIIFIAKTENLRYYVLGNGSNVLASDDGFDGVVICTKYLDKITVEDDKVSCASGVKLPVLLSLLKDNCLTGLEQLIGIPATVGGATYMNAGANGVQISDRIISVQTLSDGRLKKYKKSQCGFNYRDSIFQKNDEIILSVNFSFDKAEYQTCSDRLSENFNLRKKFPTRNSCGCIFKNPLGAYAGELIEKAGLKGFSIGGATVAEEHANFILTSENTRANDVYKVINHVKNTVKSKFNVVLREEVKYLGDF